MAMKTVVSVVVTHQPSDNPIADFLEHDRDALETAAVAHDNATRDPSSSQIWTENASS
jgi:hypothetical protein